MKSVFFTDDSQTRLLVASGAGESRTDGKPVAVLHRHMTHEAQSAPATTGLSIKSGIGIGGRGMRLIRALLLVEVVFSSVPVKAARPSRPSA